MRTMNLARQPKNTNRPVKPLSENILRCMSPQDRKKMGQLTAKEATQKAERETERQMHVEVTRECLRQRIYVLESRMDRRTTCKVGHPDLTLLKNGFVMLLELKAPGGRLSTAQIDTIGELEQCGNETVVANDTLQAINAIHAWLDRIGARHST